jgi:hypothetical protein
MAARSVVGNLHDRSKGYGVWRMFRTGRRGRHEVCAHRRLGAAVPHSRAAKGAYPLGKVDIDVMKEGKKLLTLNNFW